MASWTALNYSNWQFWGPYNPPLSYGEQKVTFDGVNKLIIVNQGVTSLDFRTDVYSAWKEWLFDPNQVNLKYAQALSAVGGDPLPGDRVLGTTYFLENGWRMRTWEGNHELTMTGNVFTREGESIFIPTINPWTITINLNTSTLVETIIPTLSLGVDDITAVADAVWSEVISGTTAAQRLIQLQTSIDGNSANTAAISEAVWTYVIDSTRNEQAKDKLRKIATKTQDLALS